MKNNNSYTKLQLNKTFDYTISLSDLFKETSNDFKLDYGGDLEAYSFVNVDANDWFESFRSMILESIGKKFLPLYRMADGEFQFFLGQKLNKFHPRLLRHFLAFSLKKGIEKIKGPSLKTSWGEEYSGEEFSSLRIKYIESLRELLKHGLLCVFLYENPKNAFVYYNKHFMKFASSNLLNLTHENYFPFHFPLLALTNSTSNIFYENRKILIISGNLKDSCERIEKNLRGLGASSILFYEISAHGAMKDVIDPCLARNANNYDIALIGAGIGSLNIISQLEWFNGPVIDVGGLITALKDKNFIYHGGAVKFPVRKSDV